jgi:DNA polymerase III epsilon subunit-like protein
MIALVFDTETTGLPKKRRASLKDNENWPYIVQMSWLTCNMETGEICAIKDYIVRLDDHLSIPIEASNIHGITNEIMREKGISIKEVLEDFWRDLQKSQYIVAHNLNFDKTITRVEMYRNGFLNMYKRTKCIEVCTMTDGAMICNISRLNSWTKRLETKPPKLIELYKKLFNSTPQNLHNSLIDVFVCFRCFYKMLYDKDIFVDNPAFKDRFLSIT